MYYLRLTREERRDLAKTAVSLYNLADKRMQAAFDDGMLAHTTDEGVPARHSPFDGDYARQYVQEAVQLNLGRRRSVKDGYGLSMKQEAEIVADAVAIRRELVQLGIVAEYAKPKNKET